MKSTHQIFSHLAVFAAAVGLGILVFGAETKTPPDEESNDKDGRRGVGRISNSPAGLWAPYLAKGSRNKVSEKTIELARKDTFEGSHEEVLEQLLSKLPAGYRDTEVTDKLDAIEKGCYAFKGEEADLIATFEARIAKWLKESPKECSAWISTLSRRRIYQCPLLVSPVADYVKDVGLEAAMQTMGTLRRSTTVEVMRLKLQEIGTAQFLKAHGQEISQFSAQPVFRYVSFQDRDLVLNHLLEDERSSVRRFQQGMENLLRNPEMPAAETAAWLRDLNQGERIPEDHRLALQKLTESWLTNHPEVDFNERISMLRDFGKDNDDLEWNTAYADVEHLFRNGRDFRFEYERGRISAEEVLKEMKTIVPGVDGNAEEGLRVSVFRHLAETDYKRAISLLDSLDEESRRSAIYNTTTRAFINQDPAKLLEFTRQAPASETPEEKAQHYKGWDWRARFFIRRHGDDYVEWVQQIPESPDRWEAIESVIWATGEIDKEKSVELRKEIYGRINAEK